MDVTNLNYKASNQFQSFENNQYNMQLGTGEFTSGGGSIVHVNMLEKTMDNNSAQKKNVTPINHRIKNFES